MDAQQLIYLYDLPKNEVTSKQIAQVFKDQANVVLDQKPQIKKDLTKPFYTAMVSIKDPKQFNEACEKMRYFNIGDKPCRALPFDKQLLGSNKEKLQNHNIFVKVNDKNMKHEDLHKLFEQVGKIKSLKVSLNSDFSSRGYGFICFQEEQGATNALNTAANFGDQVIPVKFEPKDRRHFRKLINNIYVKNIPDSMSEDELVKMFSSHGQIKSLKIQEGAIGRFAFVCYDDPTGQNKEYGPMCAQKAIDESHDREIDGMKLIVKHALKKADRDLEKQRDTIRYKQSKKRCNLYVKNFPSKWTEDDIRKLFQTYGEIEKIRIGDPDSNRPNRYAFVCYKEPQDAAKAKQNLQNHTVEGKMLMINYYEIKEVRQLQIEEAKDKADWERYQSAQTGGLKWNDLTSQPHLAQMLQQLLGIIQVNEQTNQMMHQGERQYRGGKRPYQHRGNYQGQHGGHHQGGQMGGHQMNQQQIQHQQMQQQRMMQQQQQQPMAQGNQMPNQPMPQQQMAQQQQQQMNPQQSMIAQRYFQTTQRYINAISPQNPHLKQQVGQCIYEFVQQIVGDEKAPKITGMLIELPIDNIKAYMMDYNNLEMKVKEAVQHWESAAQGQ